MRGLFKYLFYLLLSYCLLGLLCPFVPFLKERSLNNQINYLDGQRQIGLFHKQQARYPEGKVFAFALFALSIIEQGASSERQGKERAEMVDACVRALVDGSTLDNFDKQLNPPFGAFYNGWTNTVMKRYQNSDLFQFSDEMVLVRSAHIELSEQIISAKVRTEKLLETYAEGCWPADNLVALTSLPDTAITTKSNWLRELLDYRDDSLGLITHVLDDRQLVRGCSQAMIQYFLADYSAEEFEGAYQVFSEQFVDDYGVQFVREHRRGRAGDADFDSGPVVLGYGSAATVMHIKTGRQRGEDMRLTWGLLNLLGMPINIFGQKYYLFKQEPMFDLFMLWVGG